MFMWLSFRIQSIHSSSSATTPKENKQTNAASLSSDDNNDDCIQLLQYRPMGEGGGKHGKDAIVLQQHLTIPNSKAWVVVQEANNKNKKDNHSNNNHTKYEGGILSSFWKQHVLIHFLPADYPNSVSSGYARFALYSFIGSVAGSAAMVLSTQTLLLAVGVVGSQQTAAAAATASTGIMAGALNWVVKDGMGQLGGVLFASQMGRNLRHYNFDSHPKQWRVMSAVLFDVANLADTCAPYLVTTGLVLPLACASNVLKNIGYLSASASRAALHQSLCQSRNLADVTAKAATQAMTAGLLGTAVGIAMSAIWLQEQPSHFIVGFSILSFIHQICTYTSLQYVDLRYFNRPRLDILLHHYIQTNQVLSPSQVARHEVYLPFLPNYYSYCRRQESSLSSSSYPWLFIGSPLQILAPQQQQQQEQQQQDDGASLLQWQTIASMFAKERYVLNVTPEDGFIHVTFWDTATGHDVIRGILHGHLVHQYLKSTDHSITTTGGGGKERDEQARYINNRVAVQETYQTLQTMAGEEFFQKLDAWGWITDSNATHVEPYGAVRIALYFSPPTERGEEKH